MLFEFGLHQRTSLSQTKTRELSFHNIISLNISLLLLAVMAVDGIDALGLAASAAILVYASSGRAASSGQRDGKPLLMVGCGGLLISAVRLGAKIILKAEGPSRDRKSTR